MNFPKDDKGVQESRMGLWLRGAFLKFIYCSSWILKRSVGCIHSYFRVHCLENHLGEKQGINNKLKYPSSYQSLICQVWYKELLINCGYGALRQICYLLLEPAYRKPIFGWFLPPGYPELGVKEWNMCFKCRNSWIKWPLGKPRYFKHLVLKCRNQHSISLYVRTSHR